MRRYVLILALGILFAWGAFTLAESIADAMDAQANRIAEAQYGAN